MYAEFCFQLSSGLNIWNEPYINKDIISRKGILLDFQMKKKNLQCLLRKLRRFLLDVALLCLSKPWCLALFSGKNHRSPESRQTRGDTWDFDFFPAFLKKSFILNICFYYIWTLKKLKIYFHILNVLSVEQVNNVSSCVEYCIPRTFILYCKRWIIFF